ncbi:DUF4238 domain-containing protein [Streptomyces griseosporeus]|uniref:DUF4238 domain-containing protein n=1 Tax=Streptomyces griseosporeus TaxID=1910 RepID=UPI0036F4ED58
MNDARRVVRQHLVSQVLLKRFTMPGTRGSGWQLLPFDLDHPDRNHKLKGPGGCGWIENFVNYDSSTAEAIWGRIEKRAPEAFAAVDSGTPFDNPDHAEILRDMVALHLVRSHRYRDMHRDAFKTVRQDVLQGLMLNYSEQLCKEALRKTGLQLTGPQGLEAFADRLIESSEPAQDHASGKLFRGNIEEMFRKVRAKIAVWQLEVITPQEGQFLIGDTPAITLRRGGSGTQYGMAIGDAHTMVLPLGPHRLLALGPQNCEILASKELVDELNAVQVLAAKRYVYMHPRSGLEHFVKVGVESRTSR